MSRIRFPFLLALLLITYSAKGALNGIYTINASSAATATNYLTFTSAVSDMVSGTRADGGPANGSGVTGAVTFNVSAATYTERIMIPAITGASATNTITFNGASPLTSVITFASTTISDYTIQLNGADYIRITNLGVHNTGAAYGYPINLVSSADNNIISGCNISTPITSTSNYHAGIMVGTYFTNLGVNAANLNILNNTISGGRFSIVANGISTNLSPGLVISGNTSVESHFVAFYLQYMDQAQIVGNTITSRPATTGAYGAQLRYCNGGSVDRNRFLNPGAYGLYLIGSNSTGSSYTMISNNMIGGGFQTISTAYGLYLTSCARTRVFHNSILVDNPGSTARPLYISSSVANIEILNNVLSAAPTNGTGGIALYVTPTTGISLLNNNLYHSNGTQLAYFGANYATLAALQAAAPTFNTNSQSGPPNFVSNTDLHTFGVAHADWATPTTITSDFDQQVRPLAPDLIPDVGADEFNLPPVDPDLVQILSPLVGTVGPNTVTVSVRNNGGSSLNGSSLTMEYSTDGGTTWTGTQVFTPTALGTPGSTQSFSFSTLWNIVTPGNFNICARINPVMPGDPDPLNQICISICTGLGGTYTINNTLPTGGTNFNSFNAAAAALGTCGISGPTTFNIAPGSYVENVIFSAVAGAGPSSRVTFDGANANLVNLNFNSSVINNSIVKLDGADYFTFRNMTVEVTGTNGFCYHLTNEADYNIIENCRLLLSTTTSSLYQIGLVIAGATYSTAGNNANYTIFRDNYVRGGYYGARINGISTTSYTNENQLLRNVFEDFYYYGIYSLNQRAPVFDDNTINIRTTGTSVSTFGYGIYISVADSSFSISGNIIPKNGAYGVYMSGGNRNNTGRGRIENNMIGGEFSTTGLPYGLYITSSRDIDIRHNSIQVIRSTGNAIYVIGNAPTTDSLRIRNNILSCGNRLGAGYGTPLRVSNNTTIQQLNYNTYFTNGGITAEYGGVQYATLANFQAAYPAYNQNSNFGFPGFRTDTDLHIICSQFDNLGNPSPVVVDVDNNPRSATTPDIGADEYTAISVSYSLGPDTANCGRLYLTADTVNFTNYFWGGLQTGPTTFMDTTGSYHITVIDSNNCLARDTIGVTILDYPVLVFGGDTIPQCAATPVSALNPGSTFLWSTGDTTAVLTPTVGGFYTVDITTADGCTLRDSLTIALFAAANANLGADTTFCNGGGHLLDAGAGATGTTYIWNTGSTTQVVGVSASGWYAVTVASPQGCTASDSVFMNVLLPPVVNLGPDRFECGPFALDAGNGGNSYLWNTSANTQVLSSSTSGLYSVTVSSPNGCTTTDQVQISVATPPNVNLGSDPVICDGAVATFSAQNPGMIYQWSTGQTSQSISVSIPGIYIVNVIDPVTQCSGSDTVEVIQSNMNIELGPNFTLCIGDQAVLDAGSSATSYLWNTGSTNQLLNVTQSGTYSVQITDGLGCIARDTILVTVQTPPTVAFTGPASIPLLQPAQFNDGSSASITSWLWDFGDGQFSTAQNPTYTYQAMGTFTVCLTGYNGTCDSTFCQTIVVGAPVEVADEMLSGFTTVYPNPSHGEYQIAFDLPTGLDLEMEVYSLAGQRLHARSLKGVRTQVEALDLRMEPNGVYMLMLRSSKGHLMVTKLVKE